MDIYERLAGKLNELPNGFPRTKSGVELKILRILYLPEEAEMAVKMSAISETAAKIAQRVGKPIGDVEAFLDVMVSKAHIHARILDGVRKYCLNPFIIGSYEGKRYSLEKELAELYEEYYPAYMKVLGGFAPAFGRVLPVASNVAVDRIIHSSDDVRKMIEEGKTFNLKICICRTQQEILGSPCKHGSKSYCLGISKEENDFTGPEAVFLGKNISKEEALEVIADAEKEGLVHCVVNVDLTNAKEIAICNCCECCCKLMVAHKNFKVPYMYAESAYLAKIDQDKCTGCGICKDQRCPMDAIAENEGSYTVINERCLGCGVCTVTCPADAISLEQNPKADSTDRPADGLTWKTERAQSRGIPFPPASDPH